MSITNELREFAKRWPLTDYRCKDMLAIADRIDAAHKHAIGYVDDRDPETMAENGWVELPKDADGKVIRIGDMVEWIDGDGSHAMEVTYLQLTSDGWYVGVKNYGLCGASELLRHHKQPTVEDVLTDLCEHVWESALLGSTWSDSPVESYITEYAAKMRLAGEVDG